MSNRRFIVFFLLGIVSLGTVLVVLSLRARVVATAVTRSTLCDCAADEIASITVARDGTKLVTLARDFPVANVSARARENEWNIVSPFFGQADVPTVTRLVDALTLVRFDDIRSERELERMGKAPADFGLAENARVKLTVVTRRNVTNEVALGKSSASGSEVYAQVRGLRNVFILPAKVLAAVPNEADGFRLRSLVRSPRGQITGIDLRAPEKAFVKLVRRDDGWRIAEPMDAAADAATVAKLTRGLTQGWIAGFVLTAATNRMNANVSPIKPELLEQYGLGDKEMHSVAVRLASGETEQIGFGKAVGTNLVYALVRNRTEVVTVDAAVADVCRDVGDLFRNLPVFALADKEELLSVSFTSDNTTYKLAREVDAHSNKVWWVRRPFEAEADAKVAAAFVDRVFHLRRNDVPKPSPGQPVMGVEIVTVRESATNVFPRIDVPKTVFAKCGALDNLRSKTVFRLDDPANVKRMTVKTSGGTAIAVVRDDARSPWCRDGVAVRTVGELDPAAVKSLFAALTLVEAESVMKVGPMQEDRRQCGLDRPQLTIAIDFFGDSPRRNLLIGGEAEKGGRYATLSGVDTIFVLPSATVKTFFTPLTK